jgi:antitoxin (DNA-binding transcriptional repressor) of toxin-antitoxin stability system
MKVMSVGEFKTNFSQVLKRVQAGEEIDIAYGKGKEIVARLIPKPSIKKRKRKIGVLDTKGKIKFNVGYKMTEQEFLEA